MLLPVPWLRGLDGRLRVALDWRDPAVKQVFVLMLPVTLGLGLINFNAVVDTLFASRLIDPEQAPRAIDLAFRLYMLPQGIFSVAVATILFPTLARLAARGDMDGFRRTSAIGPAPDRLPAHPRQRCARRAGDADRARSSTSTARSRPTRPPSSRSAWQRSRSASPSTARC